MTFAQMLIGILPGGRPLTTSLLGIVALLPGSHFPEERVLVRQSAIKEGALDGLAFLFDVDADAPFTASLIDRAGSAVPVLLMGPFNFHTLSLRVSAQ